MKKDDDNRSWKFFESFGNSNIQFGNSNILRSLGTRKGREGRREAGVTKTEIYENEHLRPGR